MKNVLALMLVSICLSCTSSNCLSRVQAISDWIAEPNHYDCKKPEKLVKAFSSVCKNTEESDVPKGFFGSLVCTLCLDIPLAKLNGIFEDAECSKLLVNKTAKETLINTCKILVPFSSKKKE